MLLNKHRVKLETIGRSVPHNLFEGGSSLHHLIQRRHTKRLHPEPNGFLLELGG